MWMNEVGTLMAAGKIEEALGIVFNNCDNLLIAGKFDEINTLLDQVDTDRMNIELMVGLLAATLPAKDKLSARKHYYEKVKVRLTELVPDRVDRIMKGL